MLRETESLDEQGDILQYLVDTHGLDFNTGNIQYKKLIMSDCLKTFFFINFSTLVAYTFISVTNTVRYVLGYE